MKSIIIKIASALLMLAASSIVQSKTLSICVPNAKGQVHIAAQCGKDEHKESVSLMVLTPEVAREIKDVNNLGAYLKRQASAK